MARAFGIDVSKWQGFVNIPLAKLHGISFIICKASEYIPDPCFKTTWANARANGLIRGAYHYLDFEWSEIEQAKLFVGTMNGDWGEIPPILDLEDLPLPGMTSTVVINRVSNFLNYVENATGKTPMIYTGYYYWNQWGNKTYSWIQHPLWLAWYAAEIFVKTPQPWSHWNFWQPSSNWNGPYYGCQSKSVDGDYFNGTVEDLKRFVGALPAPTPPAPEPIPAFASYKVIVPAINIRNGPSTTAQVVRIAWKDEILHVMEEVPTNGYLRLADDNWAFAAYLQKQP